MSSVIGLVHNFNMNKIHFAHANGFPANSYSYFFSYLKGYAVNSINTMGHDNYPVSENLSFLADELINYVSNGNDKPVIGIGHSSGGAAILFAAAKRPELFKQVILIDPVLLGSKKRLAIKLSKLLGLWSKFSPANKARKRRKFFEDKAEAFQYYSTKALFKDFDENCFKDYIEHGLKPNGQNYELLFSPMVEGDIFDNVPTYIPRDLTEINATILYASNSNLFGQTDVNWWKKNHPEFDLKCFEGNHLFPFEQPEAAAKAIAKIIDL